MSKNDTIKELESLSGKDAQTTRTQDVVGKIFNEMEEIATKYNSQIHEKGILSPDVTINLQNTESKIKR